MHNASIGSARPFRFVGLVALVSAIIEGPSKGWTSPIVSGLFGIAVVALAVFAVWESKVDAPMLDVHFFRNPRFSAASANITLMFFALFGFVFLSTQYLQFVLGYSPLGAGVRTLPFAAAMLAVAPFSSTFCRLLRDQAGGGRRNVDLRRRSGTRVDDDPRRPATPDSAWRCCCSVPVWAWREPRPPSRSWARCRGTVPASAPR